MSTAHALSVLGALLALVQAPRLVPPRPSASPRGPSFEIVSCSLGCVPGTSGLVCRQSEIHVNEELRFTFNLPLDPASISNNSFRVLDTAGRTPAASLSLAPGDPATLVYRPQLTFDSAGNPIFGLVAGQVYLLHIPGTEQGPGPYLTSLDGTPNRTRLLCALVASRGVADVVPGRPFAKVYVQAVVERDAQGNPVRIERVPAAGATDVLRSSPIEIVFGDLMNPATLANPVTGTSTFVRVFFDPDGDVTRPADQVPVAGSFALSLDQNRASTHLLFSASGGLPPSGTQRRPGRVVLFLSPQIQDLAGQTLSNPGTTSFTTEAR
ncbi:MAG TPA: Ig-like domain-containing protein [Planctomycetota bacterium]